MTVKKTIKACSLFLSFLVLLSLPLFIPGCSGQQIETEDKMIIAVSISPLEEFVEKIYGNGIDTLVLVPAGADPHTYEPRPSQLREVSEADMLVIVGSGLGFEITWLDKIASLNDDMVLVDCSKGIELIETGEADTNGNDPHIWLSLDNAVMMTENIYDALADIDPDNSKKYLSNLLEYQESLKDLDKRIREQFDSMEVKKIIVLHPAWTYFAKDYGIEQIPIEVEGKEPTPANIKEIIDRAKKEDIKVIFASPEFSTRSAEVIADEIGAEVVLVSPVEKNYLANMEKVAMVFSGREL
jgi:zinc transport system substrate-binding protein